MTDISLAELIYDNEEARLKQMVSRIQIWLAACRSYACSKSLGSQQAPFQNRSTIELSKGSQNPMRLVDVGNKTFSRRLKVVYFRYSRPLPYLTLSHCWGKNANLTLPSLTAQTEPRLIAGILENTLPRAFRQAIRITWGLGFRYIWIGMWPIELILFRSLTGL